MNFAAVIPARMGSTRFPGKILASRTGKPLIEHVWERVRSASGLSRIVIATDDERIAEAVRIFGGEAWMTRPDHPNGTARIAEVAERLDCDAIINVQGDEPEIDPGTIEAVIDALRSRPDVPMSTAAAPFGGDDAADPNVVKVTLRVDGTALCFSRSLIPFDRDRAGSPPPLRHLGIYGYRRAFLATYVSLPETPLERCERLEQLRVLEHGFPIAVALVASGAHGIDTEEQYDAFVARSRRS
ncbi:MAG TPA: 3-deoxy-manno-octulosonate cytidylyltransferase [Phycisphaerales bacterium]|nr:3-deoxy-manno-octulosonate cytidylyltransferase [Phycisphaerales bacterium]HMP38135.1 3-deoxy-manno-octulosonate cytidylyltransferase [Phycisphaerales bacterium]